jgi:DNA-binding NtrC family response regulator
VADGGFKSVPHSLFSPVFSDFVEDIPGLCEILSAQIAKDLKVRPKRMSPEALQKIANYAFPGNIRELRNLLERAHILGHGGEIISDELLGGRCRLHITSAPRWQTEWPKGSSVNRKIASGSVLRLRLSFLHRRPMTEMEALLVSR